ncbi:MAG: prolyl oligopeptidase family serine peptidase [Chitinophagaceae bacterium]|nr:prolyl oligopeptidase family serine peptidase [Chitinophagaceae bacterium]
MVYFPQGYNKDTTKQWPVVLFLHGSGERGTDVQKVKKNGLPKLIEEGKQYPFIVISPQAPPDEGWEEQMMYRFIKYLRKTYRIDGERIYLTGLSMGGFGTWSIAMKFPSLFAAVAPVCGGGDTADIWKLRHMPVWCFHGAKDDVVKPEQSYRMMNALKKYNPSAKLTIYPEANHNSWDSAYNNDSLYIWLLQQKKYHSERKPLKETELSEYAGAYVQEDHDTVHLIIQNSKLVVKEQPDIEVIPSTSGSFFVKINDEETEVQFHKDRKGRIDYFILFADKLMRFNKIK